LAWQSADLENGVSGSERVVSAKFPLDLASRLDEVARRIDRSKSWIIRQALADWLAEERRRYELSLEELNVVDEGRTPPAEEVPGTVEQRTCGGREAPDRSGDHFEQGGKIDRGD
jgi:predicted transcriptional regulator